MSTGARATKTDIATAATILDRLNVSVDDLQASVAEGSAAHVAGSDDEQLVGVHLVEALFEGVSHLVDVLDRMRRTDQEAV